ncbi:MAG: hypothetical protein K2J10_02890 [Muribaculaceae bacterium]|nr:hypothetical protein [Muribaculaceae bacterium]
MKRRMNLLPLIICGLLITNYGCNYRCNKDGNNDANDISNELTIDLCPRILDSAETQALLGQAVTAQFIGMAPASYELPIRTDLEYLPYLMIILQNPDRYPYNLSPLLDDLVSICTNAIDDEGLYLYGRRIYSKYYNRKEDQESGYPKNFSADRNPTYNFSEPPSYQLNMVDTLRVQALLHNDRKALNALEKYYRDKGKTKDLAIYYKVLLCYPGNGDLAERFYNILQPYFKFRPEVRTAVREVLLRAAICDHNARAQELCDSLGYSLCDYRLPLPK